MGKISWTKDGFIRMFDEMKALRQSEHLKEFLPKKQKSRREDDERGTYLKAKMLEGEIYFHCVKKMKDGKNFESFAKLNVSQVRQLRKIIRKKDDGLYEKYREIRAFCNAEKIPEELYINSKEVNRTTEFDMVYDCLSEILGIPDSKECKKSRGTDFIFTRGTYLWEVQEDEKMEKREEQALKEIREADNLKKTEKETLIKSRRGQGRFRERIMDWCDECIFAGVKNPIFLRAGHLKPWAVCSNQERLDPYNGVLLTPAADFLLDRGFISFSDDGTVLFSGEIDSKILKSMGIDSKRKYKMNLVDDSQVEYIRYHRENVFRK